MDAVIVPKLLAGEGFVRETQASEPPAPDSSVFRRPEASGAGSCHLEYSSLSRGLDGHAKLYSNKNLVSTFKCQSNGRTHYDMGLSRNEEKHLMSKSKKTVSSLPGSKRPRTDQPECSVRSAGADNCENESRKFESGVRKCSSSEKTRVSKQKRALNAKKPDKKNIKTGGKTKYDSLAMKPALTRTDSVCTGNNVLDLYNVTSNVDDPPLCELLDGSYKCPSSYPEKIKKASPGNENILLSIKKAIDTLPTHGARKGSCKAKGLICPPGLSYGLKKSADSDCKDKCVEVTESSGKVQNSQQPGMNDSTLYQPKDLLKRLMLPPTPDVGVLISELNASALPLHSTSNINTLRGASLPPFPWSFSSNSCKSSLDMGKSAPARNTCQSRWTRIGRNSTSFGAGPSCFEFDLQNNHQKLDNLVEDIKSLLSIQAVNLSHIVSGQSVPVKSTQASNEYKSQPCLLGKQAEGFDCHIKLESHDNAFHGSFQIQCASRFQGKSCSSILSGKADEGTQKSHPFRSLNSSSSISDYPCACKANGCNHGLHSTTSGTSKEDHSPRVVSAAKILYELSTSSVITSIRNHHSGKEKSTKEQSHNALKVHKSISPSRKVDEACQISSRHDPARGVGLSSARHKLIFEKSTTHMNGISRGPTRWPTREGLSPNKSEKDPGFDKPLHDNSMKPTDFILSPTRAEKFSDHQHRIRKMAINNSPSSFSGAHIKDWNRGKMKKL